MAESMNMLSDWVKGDTGGQNRGESTVLLHVTHSNLTARLFEIRLDRHMTIERVKEKLRTHTGTGLSPKWLHSQSLAAPTQQLE